jgi:predicted DNA-binding protein
VIKLNALIKQRISESLLERVDAIAEKKSMTRTAFINMVLADYIDEIDDRVKIAELTKRIEILEKDFFEKKEKGN